MTKIRFKDYLKDYLEYNKISNKDFAERIGISQKHLIDILAGNMDLSSSIIEKISLVTDIPMSYIYNVETNYKLEKEIDTYLLEEDYTISRYLNKYDYKYLIENKYIDFTDPSDKMEITKDILKFLRVTSPRMVNKIDNGIYFKSNNNKPEMLALWLEKCYRESLKQEVGEYHKDNIDILVNYIKECAKKNHFHKNELIKEFNKYGICLVIIDDIPGSKIRGAFRVNKDTPCIYLTRKYHRIADVYFALLHELAHCKSDYNRAKASSLVSYETDKIEDNADKQAFNWMVSEDDYQFIASNPKYDISKEEKYPKAFVVYLLAHSKKINYNSTEYQKYNALIEID